MALNSSGPIYLGNAAAGQSIADEIGQLAGTTIYMNDTNPRFLAQNTSTETAISLGEFLGRSRYINVTSNNWINNYYIPGIDSGGGGPTEQNGTYSGNVLGYCIFLKNYIADSGPQWTPARDIAIVSDASTISYSALSTLLIEKNDVRSISGSKTLSWTVDVDNNWYFGYWDITVSATPAISDVINGSYISQGSTYQPGGGRQRGLGFSFTIPVPPANHIYVPACYSDRGSSNHYITIS